MRTARRSPRLILALALGLAGVAPILAVAQAVKSKAAELPAFTPEREASTRDFVRRHHPELIALLDRLRPMNGAEYEKVIRELSRTIDNLDALRARDPARYQLALDAWRAKSRVERLAAQHSRTRSDDSESTLKQALAAQLEVEIAQRRFERDAVAARLKKMDEQIERLDGERSTQIEARLRRLTRGRTVAKARSAETSGPGKDSPQRNAKP